MTLFSRSSFNSDSHYGLHWASRFEGFYSKLDLPSGASVIVVICSVPKAPQWPNSLFLTHVTKQGRVWQREWRPDRILGSIDKRKRLFDFSTADGVASLSASPSAVSVKVTDHDISFASTCSDRTPWSSRHDSPEGVLSLLPIPLHWHVESLASQATFNLQLPSEAKQDPADREGIAVAHLEKNWGHRGGFPSSHMWVQARDGSRHVCLAGGRTMMVDAFLVGYANPDKGVEMEFRPPFALKVLGFTPFMSHVVDWNNRLFVLDVQDFSSRVRLEATATLDGSWFTFRGPSSQGHSNESMCQTLNAAVTVTSWQRRHALAAWHQKSQDLFSKASLEFGGHYYRPKQS